MARYASARLADVKRLEDEAIELGRRSVREMYEAGRALVLIRDKLKPKKKWVAWQRKSGHSRTQVNRATRLYEAAVDPSALSHLASIADALAHFGIEDKKPSAGKARSSGGGTGEDKKPSAGKARSSGGGTGSVGGEGGAVEGGTGSVHSTALASPTKGEDDNGNIQIADGSALVHAALLEQVSATDKARPLLVARVWDQRTKAALGRGTAVLLIPELDDRWQPVGEARQ